ncbi:HNH endonuclease signature motif containing protein [Streptomyces sp. NPDC093546]|uniref:HNH endonuclease signature motif containing protein n=1 Tax=Streptomyces sp. NPDC093546 TaxID=3366040 RepID=UPI003814CD40
MPTRYTHELLAEAARRTNNWDDAVRWCGGTPTPGRRRYLRQKMADSGVDVSHFRTHSARHTEERLRQAVAAATSVNDVVRRLGLSPVGGNQAHIGRRIAALGIDTSHFPLRPPQRRHGPRGALLTLRAPENGRVPGERLRRALLRTGVPEECAMCRTGPAYEVSTAHFVGQGHQAGRPSPTRKSAADILRHSSPGSPQTKTVQLRRALDELGVPHRCQACGTGDVWQGKRLILEIDHINGDRLDNRLENLRYLCPSCHSQTRSHSTQSRRTAASTGQ